MKMIWQQHPGIDCERTVLAYITDCVAQYLAAFRVCKEFPASIGYQGEEKGSALPICSFIVRHIVICRRVDKMPFVMFAFKQTLVGILPTVLTTGHCFQSIFPF